jgi:hypothetical protein
MMVYGPNSQKTKAITAALAKIESTPDTTVQRMDEMELSDPYPEDGQVEAGKLKEN